MLSSGETLHSHAVQARWYPNPPCTDAQYRSSTLWHSWVQAQTRQNPTCTGRQCYPGFSRTARPHGDGKDQRGSLAPRRAPGHCTRKSRPLAYGDTALPSLISNRAPIPHPPEASLPACTLPLRQGAAGDCARGQTVWRRVALRRRGSGALALVARVRQRRCVLDGTCVRVSHHTPIRRSMWDAPGRPRSRHRKSCSGACPTCPVHSPSLEGACHL